MNDSANPLSAQTREQRYLEEQRQGQLMAQGDESAWGWSGPAGTIRAERRAQFLIEQAGLRPSIRCLELGCGTGQFTQRLIPSGCTLSAVEISPATADICRQKVAGKAEILVGNVETGQGMEGRTFDAIVGVSVLHHLNMDMCFAATFALLRPGGRFAFVEPNMANPQIWAERHIGIVKKLRHVTAHETAFFTGQLRRQFEAAGLVVDLCRPFEFLHPSTPKPLLGLVMGLERVVSATPLLAIAGSIQIAGHKPERA